MYCGNCGTWIDESKICSKCGMEINKITEKESHEEIIEDIYNELQNYNEINGVQEEKKEMTKKEIKENKKLQKKMERLNKRFKGDQELIDKYLNVESNGHIIMFLFGLVTVVNHYFFQYSPYM